MRRTADRRRSHGRGLWLAVALMLAGLAVLVAQPAAARPGPPRVDPRYHDPGEVRQELAALALRAPGIVARVDLGRSAQGRHIWAVKLSDAVAVDEDEPEVLLVAGQHAREHLSVEVALAIARRLAQSYGLDPRVTRLLDTRELWIVPDLNPDGRAYDLAGRRYRLWRKNRQPQRGRAVGVDLNRNWGFAWGCCGGSSRLRFADDYRGPAPFSAPETRRLRDFVASRVVGGVQQIRAAIDLHSHAQLVLWPFGFTHRAVTPRLGRRDRAVFAALGTQVAAADGYRGEQQSHLYIADGTLTDWLWATQGISSLTVELGPAGFGYRGFYPPASRARGESAANLEAVLELLDVADCPARVVAGQTDRCRVASSTLFADDFEHADGWTPDPAGTDTASAGRWRRGLTARRGRALVTGSASEDVDGGTASVLSPPVTVPATGRTWLRFSSLLRDGPRGSRRDVLRVSAVTADGARIVLHVRHAVAGVTSTGWARATVSLDDVPGQTVRILVEAVDAGRDSAVDAGIDRVRVTHEEPR